VLLAPKGGDSPAVPDVDQVRSLASSGVASTAGSCGAVRMV